ncbi:uncharacterized protein LOC131878056 [Tigriopus californicus]|nr:uncharacterized protein LOC131878056 [Tigriopus californicus]
MDRSRLASWKLSNWSPFSRLSLIFLAAITVLIFIQDTSAIKCWVCRSDGDPKCADPFDNTSFPITDCKQEKPREHLPGLESTMCRKVRQKVNGNWRYLRSCAWLGEPGIGRDERYCIHRSGTYNIHVEYCTCRSKDGCNGAGTAQSFLLMTGLPLALSVLYSRLFLQRL